MMNRELKVSKVSSGFALTIQTKYKLKIWPWVYKDESTAHFVKNKIEERWEECLVQRYEDYTKVFVENEDLALATGIDSSEMKESWIDTENKKVDIRKVSGYA